MPKKLTQSHVDAAIALLAFGVFIILVVKSSKKSHQNTDVLSQIADDLGVTSPHMDVSDGWSRRNNLVGWSYPSVGRLRGAF